MYHTYINLLLLINWNCEQKKFVHKYGQPLGFFIIFYDDSKFGCNGYSTAPIGIGKGGGIPLFQNDAL